MTIVITHDLSQIQPKDFVYVLKDGMVVEQGFRFDLEAEPKYGYEGEEGVGEFREMIEAQRRTGGFLPEKSLEPSPPEEEVHALLDADDEQEPIFNLTVNMKHQSLACPALRPLTLGNWIFDAVPDLTSTTKPLVPASAVVASRDTKRISRFVPISLPFSFGWHSEMDIEIGIRHRTISCRYFTIIKNTCIYHGTF
jgi:ATP-binding cassette subfamily B (MDR/TAP) protein 1